MKFEIITNGYVAKKRLEKMGGSNPKMYGEAVQKTGKAGKSDGKKA